VEEVKKWLFNCARNENKPTPGASAITTKKACAETVGVNEVASTK
jgi:hypothetical protein